jgi:ABC-type Zn uptake system ZnuABC Zn-binding protein ZnuA
VSRLLSIAAAVLFAGGCSRHEATIAPGLHVLVTISTFESFARAVGGNRVSVTSLVPVGASPEDYQPTPADISKVHAADILVENGLGLETWLGDPAGRDTYVRNAAAYDASLVTLERQIAARIATIPANSRAMIVFHNAWQYYDDRFGLRTVGVVELSPGQEPNPQYIATLVTLARSQHVRAVFAEPEYSPKLIRALAESAGITTVQDLYDDSIGTDPRVTDYASMLRFDTATIVGALGGRAR